MKQTADTSKPQSLRATSCLALLVFCALVPTSAHAQQASAQLSSREAYIGSPIVLQLQIKNAKEYSLPEAFEIDGCDVQAVGSPSQSSRITIYNGRRSETRSITMHYRITPRRKGTFEIPELEFEVDGKTTKTESMKFVATKSETGDLLFLEIEGKQKNVYVGQPLELTLKLWIKPFQDRKTGIKLDDGNMWQLLAEGTNWGPFADRIQELAGYRQVPRGKSALRDNGQGDSREYYLYKLDATVYPIKPGKIDGDDVQAVVNYPLELSRRRDPFGSFFGRDSPFGASPFGRRVSITKSRPIVASAEVDSTMVLPIPSEGKPLDYRGAVGRYRIVTQTESKTVDAGDPVTLRIGVIGDGPMDLVQAPPLAELSELTAGFKVEDQSLAGFVQDETKVFVTTIRPRSPNVTEIPPIPFSFFDPEKEAFETVYSKAIPLTVNKSETLALDSIVGGAAASRESERRSELAKNDLDSELTGPDFENNFSADVLSNRRSDTLFDWRIFAIMPPLVWLALLVGRSLTGLGRSMPDFRSTESRASARLQGAATAEELQDALIQFISERSKQTAQTSQQAAGALRMLGLSSEANEYESFVAMLARHRLPTTIQPAENDSPVEFNAQRLQAIELVQKLESAIAGSKKSTIKSKRQPAKSALQKSTASMLLVTLLCSQGFAAQSDGNENDSASHNAQSAERLTQNQLDNIFQQANQTYQTARESANTDSAESKVAFARAATGYQTIAAQGVRNSDLFINLGNAQWQSSQPGQAIANYHRALRCNPASTKAAANLSFAQTQINLRNKTKDERGEQNADQTAKESAFNLLQLPIRVIGHNRIAILFSICSVIFWTLIAIRTCWIRFPIARWACLPLLFMLGSGVLLFASDDRNTSIAVAVVDQLEVRSGDGDEFETNFKLEPAIGRTLPVLNQRGDWLQISIPDSTSSTKKTGWVHRSKVEAILDSESS